MVVAFFRSSLALFAFSIVVACGGDSHSDGGASSDMGVDGDASGADAGEDAGCADDDRDRDGHRSSACGGDDCDDTDPTVYPGNTEICDSLGHDEDCDPATLGPDHDGDGYVSNSCCQGTGGTRVCGDDCDDARPFVSPVAPEVCDTVDDDCDGSIDEGVQLTFYRDVDGDGFGVDSTTLSGCSALGGYTLMGGDCNDALASTHPGAPDGPTANCDGVDNDCDGAADTGCACADGMTQPCGSRDASGALLTTLPCVVGMQTCAAGAWGACIGSVMASSETCNMVDDDCNGTVDDGLRVDCRADGDNDTYPRGGAARESVCADPARTAVGTCPDNYTNRAATPVDCADGDPTINPGASEHCGDAVDEDCSGMTDNGCICASCGCLHAFFPVYTIMLGDGSSTGGAMTYTIENYTFHNDGSTTSMGHALGRTHITCSVGGGTILGVTTAAYPPAWTVVAATGGGDPAEIWLQTVSVGGSGERLNVQVLHL